MLINTLLMEGLNPQEMVVKSFKQFQYDNSVNKNSALLIQWREIVNEIH